MSNPVRREPWPTLLATVVALASIAYVFIAHRGLGAPPGGMPTEWWHPTGFLLDQAWIARWHELPVVGVALLTSPALVLLGLLYLRPAPALARAAAASAAASVAIMAFYGLVAFPIWSFFHWRGSLVMLASGLALGCCLAAPDLARSLMRRPLPLAIALYVPVCFVAAAVIRNATGWDPALDFNISPWPAIPVLALEIGAYTWAGTLAGLAIGVASVAFARTPVRRALGIALGIVLPVAWFHRRFDFTEASVLALGVVIMCVLMIAAIRFATSRPGALAERATALGLAAALIALPLVGGRAMADGDYAISKHVFARQIIAALAMYEAEEGEYPESLEDLVDKHLLETLPAPRVGSGFWVLAGVVDAHGFDYRNLGSSYVLEFVSTEWVMCSYNPPWEDDFGDDGDEDELVAEVPDPEVCMAECDLVCRVDCDPDRDDCDALCGDACQAECDEQASMYAADAADDGGEAWSCPDSRPELW